MMEDIQSRRKSLSAGASPPVQQFATFHSEAPEPYTHIPTPALEPTDQLTQLSGPTGRGGPPPSNARPAAKRDRSVDIYEKHTLTKPRVDADGQPFTFRTDAAAEFEKPVVEEKPVVQIMQLPLGRRRSFKGSLPNLMSAEDVVRANAKANQVMETRERSRERGEAARMLMGNVQSSSGPIEEGPKEGIWGLAQRARDRSRSSSRNRWEEMEKKGLGEGLGKQTRRSLTVMTDSVVESDEEEENPRTGRLGSRFQ